MELPNYIPTRLPSYELPTRRFHRHHRNYGRPCVSPANVETSAMSKEEALTAQRPSFRNAPRGRLSAAQTGLGGRGAHCKRATAQGRTRLDALVTLAGFARRRREIWRNPSRLGEGVALQNGAQGSAAEMRMLCPTG